MRGRLIVRSPFKLLDTGLNLPTLHRLCSETTSHPGEEQIVWTQSTSRCFLTNQNVPSNAPKYRLVVRFSNKQIIVQIAYARLQGDFVLTSATSKELPRYGINHGLTNWAAGAIVLILSHILSLDGTFKPTPLVSCVHAVL